MKLSNESMNLKRIRKAHRFLLLAYHSGYLADLGLIRSALYLTEKAIKIQVEAEENEPI